MDLHISILTKATTRNLHGYTFNLFVKHMLKTRNESV